MSGLPTREEVQALVARMGSLEPHLGGLALSERQRLAKAAEALLAALEAEEEREDDEQWRQEQAMERGMAFGCDGYNDAMGWS